MIRLGFGLMHQHFSKDRLLKINLGIWLPMLQVTATTDTEVRAGRYHTFRIWVGSDADRVTFLKAGSAIGKLDQSAFTRQSKADKDFFTVLVYGMTFCFT